MKYLAGLPGYEPPLITEANPEDLDSDDLAELNLADPVYETTRPKPHCCQSLKEIDLYGVTPAMVIESKKKFKTWWGACFSLMAYLVFCYYIGMKGLFMVFNQTTHYVNKYVHHDEDSEHASQIWDFETGQINLELEILPDPSKIEEELDDEMMGRRVGQFA